MAATLTPFVSASAQSRPQYDPSAQLGTAESNLINADRPGIADGSIVTGAKRFQIEAVSRRSFVDGGIAYMVGQNVPIDASIGTRAHGETAPQPFIGFGISWRSKSFQRERRHE